MSDIKFRVSLESGGCFGITAQHWPQNFSFTEPNKAFGDHWPPHGINSAFVAEVEPERWFDVDMQSAVSLQRFESDFGLYVAESLPDYVAIHAALVSIGEHIVIFPGKSHSGKSSLAHAAIHAGHWVLSDEYALISITTGRVTGWPRPIRRREPDGSITRIPIPHDDREYVPTHVIDFTFSPETKQLELDDLAPSDVALSLLANAVCAQSRPEDCLRATAATARITRGGHGLRGDTSESLPALEEWLNAAL